MCGIAGLITLDGMNETSLRAQAETMATAIRHRGPDDAGVWIDDQATIALSHRRLSILDLSSKGHQPMSSEDGQWVITFNGEIYNYRELRRSLKPDYSFRSDSDTEVLLAALQTYGPEKTLSRIRGMFAFAAWNKSSRTLFLARDRMGEKPLYFGCQDSLMFFASELKAINTIGGFDRSINVSAVTDLLRYGYISDPLSIYDNVWKLEPGCCLSLQLPVGARRFSKDVLTAAVKPYWSHHDIALRNVARPFASEAEATEAIRDLLLDAIREQLVADVPVGAFLSGGIDSSLVCALAAQVSSDPVRTFAIGFSDAQFDEAPHARTVASAIGAKHHEHYVTKSDLLDVVPSLARIYDEPFADSSQIPTVLVSAIARQHVTVCLSGDGGDELFGGYNRYRLTPHLFRRLHSMPRGLGTLMTGILGSKPVRSTANFSNSLLSRFFPQTPSRLGERLTKLRVVLDSKSEIDAFNNLRMYWSDPSLIMTDDTPSECPASMPDTFTFLQSALLIDQRQYLPGDNLVKVDRASMAPSLEVRVPMLDHRLVEASWRCSDDWKIDGMTTKLILRNLLYSLLPREIVDRPKMGFSVPVGEWLRTDLKEWAAESLFDSSMNKHGLFRPTAVNELWDLHQSRKEDTSSRLWPILMFQQWYDEHIS